MEASAAVRLDMPAANPANKKIYVLDTNVLLHDPTAVAAFAEHQVVIPMTVLEELDHIKDRRDKTVSREARIAIQMIDKVVGSSGASWHLGHLPGSVVTGCRRDSVS
jgi:PhoH-like ATPase